MKKLLLLSTIVLGSFVAKADYTEYFAVSYEDENLASGATIQCHEFIIDPDGTYRYEADINVVSLLEFPIVLKADLVNAEGDENGTPSLCFNTMEEYQQGGEWKTTVYGNCFPFLPNVCPLYPEILPNTGQPTNFFWQAEALNVKPEDSCKMVLTFEAAYGDEEDYDLIEDSEFVLYIEFSSEGSGVEGIDSDNNVAPVYYNLQGVRVNEPANGLYIVKRGNKVSKEIIRK